MNSLSVDYFEVLVAEAAVVRPRESKNSTSRQIVREL